MPAGPILAAPVMCACLRCLRPSCEFTDLLRIIRQIGQFVQHDVRFEVTNRLDKCLPIEDIAKNRFGTEEAQ